MTSQFDGAWSETALIGITGHDDDNDMNFHAITETVDIDIGDKDFDTIATLSGGRLIKFTPQEPTTITLEAYPVEAGTDSGTTGKGFFDLMHTQDASEPQDIDVDRVRTQYRIAILWTNNTSITAANQLVGTAYAGLRVVAADGYFTSVKPSYTDGILKFTVVYKVPPFDSSGSANVVIQSTDIGGASITALVSYTSTNKW